MPICIMYVYTFVCMHACMHVGMHVCMLYVYTYIPFAELLATDRLLAGQTHDGIDLGVWNALVWRCLRLEQVGLCRQR